jgi:hypothetical protein
MRPTRCGFGIRRASACAAWSRPRLRFRPPCQRAIERHKCSRGDSEHTDTTSLDLSIKGSSVTTNDTRNFLWKDQAKSLAEWRIFYFLEKQSFERVFNISHFRLLEQELLALRQLPSSFLGQWP